MKKILTNERGQGLVEYVILVGLVVIVCVASARGLGESLREKFGLIKNQVDNINPSLSR
jgi:Flp pilus assembly pilin Flp